MDARGKGRQRSGHPSPEQKRKLIELMSKHPQLVAFKVSLDFNTNDSQQLWRNIASELNAIIPGSKKTWRRWRKTWQDMRSKIKKKLPEECMPSYLRKLNTAEQEALGLKNVSSTTNNTESTEFVTLDTDNMHDSFDNDNGLDMDNGSLSEPDSPSVENLFKRSPKKLEKVVTNDDQSKHSESCIFNCDRLAVQEEKKLQVKEDYYNFKKDYLKQKLLLLKEQTEALKVIARELAK